MDKLFRVLLNRTTNYKEKNILFNKNHKEINDYIIRLPEYKDFLEINYKTIENKIKQQFNGQNSRLHIKLMDMLRNNEYKMNEIDIYLNNIKKEIRKRIDSFLYQHFERNIKNIDYQVFYDIFFNNNFDYKQLEFIIANSDMFRKIVEEEINNFYLEHNIKY